MKYQLILRSKGAHATIVATGIVVFLLWALVLRTDGWIELLRVLPLGVTIFYLVWWWRFWPYLQLSSQGLLIRNPLVSVALPWKCVKEGLSHLGLYVIDTQGKKWYVSAIPATGSFSGKRKDPVMPDLQSKQDPIQRIAVEPIIAARLIDEEVYYYKKPEARANDYGIQASTDEALVQWPIWAANADGTAGCAGKGAGQVAKDASARHFNWLNTGVAVLLLVVTVVSLVSAQW